MIDNAAQDTSWQQAELVGVHRETAIASTFRFALSRPVRHLAGQHFVLRLTASDGYSASRSYSVASAPDDTGVIDLTIERLPDGEVSGFLHDVARPGDLFDLRGPIGGFFVWRGDTPAVLVGGGSGVVPFMSMLRLARSRGTEELLRLVVSVRSMDELLYANEIAGPSTTVVTTRTAAPGSDRAAGHLTSDDLLPIADDAEVYVCGSNGFADAVTGLVTAAGVDAARIRVERFGATG